MGLNHVTEESWSCKVLCAFVMKWLYQAMSYVSEKFRENVNLSVPRVNTSHCQKLLFTINKCDLFVNNEVNMLDKGGIWYPGRWQ